MKRWSVFASILIALLCNFEIEIREFIDYQKYGDTYLRRLHFPFYFLSIAISAYWCLYFGWPLARILFSREHRPKAGRRLRRYFREAPVLPFPYPQLYWIVPLFIFGFRFTWSSAEATRYSTVSFGPGTTLVPLLLAVLAVTLLNFYIMATRKLPGEEQSDT